MRTRLERGAARAAFALPAAVKRRIAGPPLHRDGRELDLDMQLLLHLDERTPGEALGVGPVARMRADLRRNAAVAAGTPPVLSRVERLVVEGAAGPLEARLYVPDEADGGARNPLLVYFHGGGWVVGDLDTHDAPCRALALAAGVRVAAVDYRLAPEHPFPAPVDDALAAFAELQSRAASLGADPDRVAVGGDSAGGHLAAVVAQHARPAAHLLLYPVTDATASHPSRRTFAEGFYLTQTTMDFYTRAFLGGADPRDPRASPLAAEDLAGVAPAIVATAGFDVLRDEGDAYAERLRDAGVRVVHRRFDGYLHGFANMRLIPGAREALAELGGALRALLSA